MYDEKGQFMGIMGRSSKLNRFLVQIQLLLPQALQVNSRQKLWCVVLSLLFGFILSIALVSETISVYGAGVGFGSSSSSSSADSFLAMAAVKFDESMVHSRSNEETCVCCASDCKVQNNDWPMNAQFPIFTNPLWDEIMLELQRFGEVYKYMKTSDISFEYHCCMSKKELMTADRFLESVFDFGAWPQSSQTQSQTQSKTQTKGTTTQTMKYRTHASAWPRKNAEKRVLLVLELDDASQALMYHQAFRYETELGAYMQDQMEKPGYTVPFRRGNVFHSALAYVDPHVFRVQEALAAIQAKFAGRLAQYEVEVGKACFTSSKWAAKIQKRFHCLD